MTLFEDAKPTPLVEPRRFRDHVDDARRLGELSDSVKSPGVGAWRRFSARDMNEFADLLGEQVVRRELGLLRKRVEEWAVDYQTEEGDALDRDHDPVVRLLLDFATTLDERIQHHRGTDEPA